VKEIIATEQVLDEYGNIVKIIYHYADDTTKELKRFIPVKKHKKFSWL